MKRLALFGVIALMGSASAGVSRVATAGPARGLVRVSADSVLRLNWAGYAAYSPSHAPFTDVKGSWQQPTANCSGGRAIAAFWVGLDGYTNSTVEQTGTEADCVGPMAIYFAWYEFYPAGLVQFGPSDCADATPTVTPGDAISAEVSRNVSDVTVTLQNADQGWTCTASTSATGLDFSSAEWIAEGPTRTLTDFGHVDFTGATASDSTGGVTDGAIDNIEWSHDDITMVGQHGPFHIYNRATDSGSPGTAFTVTWVHS